MFRDHEKNVRRMRDELRSLDTRLTSLEKFLVSFRDNAKRSLLEHGEFDGRGYSLLELIVEARRTARALINVRNARLTHLPTAQVTALVAACSALSSSARDLEHTREAIEKENRSFRIEGNGRIVTLLTREEMYNLGPLAEALFASLETLRAAATALNLTSTDVVAEHSLEEAVADLARRAASQLTEAQESARASTIAKETAEDRLSEFQTLSGTLTEEGNKLAEESRQRAAAVASLSETATTALESIRVHEEQIGTRRAQVAELADEAEADRSKLAAFASELEETRQRITQLLVRANDGKTQQDEYLKHAESLIQRAEDMVSGATVAGLAKAFDEERKELQQGMDNAMTWFFIGITFLFLVTFLLAAYVFEIPFTILGIQLSGGRTTDAVGDEVTVAGVLSRTIILLAPFWMTLFSARRYRNLFDLRQQYSHKYNLAFSIDGFRKQAPEYGEELAAWVFHEIAQRPVTSAKKMGDNPIPTLESMVAGAVERTNFFKKKPSEADAGE